MRRTTVQLPVEVGADAPKPPNVEPPKPVAADVVAVLKPPNAGAGADVDGAPKPIKSINMIDSIHYIITIEKKKIKKIVYFTHPLHRMYFAQMPMVHQTLLFVVGLLLIVSQKLVVLMWPVH